jgi:hypothetical protein
MKSLTLLAALACLILQPVRAADTVPSPKETRCFEMRTYYAAPGKFESMLARFRDHTCKLFEKHGMVNIGYWTPVDNTDNRLIYILAFPSREAAAQSWKSFGADPEWQKARDASEVNGKLVAKAESVYLKATDYSAIVKPAVAGPRVFELRTYTTTPGHLPNLNARFRNTTYNLFEKYGMVNIGYWTPTDADKGAENTLIYVLAHKSKEAAAASFKAFGGDPEWKAALKKSEEEAGGPLTTPGGVKSLFMNATDFSPMK